MSRSVVLSLLLVLMAFGAQAADIDVVRSQFVGYYTAAGADRSSPRMNEALGTLDRVARSLIAPGYLLSDGSWSDIDYNDVPDGGWGPWDHTRRLIILAKAYTTPGQSLYRDPQLRTHINAALAYTKRFYGATVFPAGNWWFWTVGIPIDLGPTLVLMRGQIDQQTYDDLVLAIALRIGRSPATKGLVGPTPVGQNLVWSSYTHLCLALLQDDPARLDAVRAAMASVTMPAAGDGIKSDGSFHQHGPQLYNGGYGGSFANDVSRHALLTRGTSYALPATALASFSDYLADGIAWTLHGNFFDVSVIGREVARETTTGFNGMAALIQGAQFHSPRAPEIRRAARKMLESWKWVLSTELAGIAANVESSSWDPAWPAGHRHYFASDYTVHRRPGWFASVKMFSTRTKSGERTNAENLFGSRQSDGRFYLSLRGDEYFTGDVWPAFDWTRLPGITVEQKADAANDLYGFGTNALAGGTGDGTNGVSAMDVAPLGSVLRARKAWIFFDDSIVFLTGGITALSGNRVETVLNQWPLQNPTSQWTRRPDWVALEGVGYWFPSPIALNISRETRSGTWSALGGSSDTTPRTKTFVTMWVDHGISPVNASAEYVIVPNVSATEMQAWAASRPLSILANGETASAARDLRSGDLGIAFWAAGSVEGIQSNAPAVVYIKQVGRDLHVWTADPTGGASGTFQLTFPGAWKTTDVVSTRYPRRTSLAIPRNGGVTTHVVLQPAPAKRRAVR